jgi:hypothetical protein
MFRWSLSTSMEWRFFFSGSCAKVHVPSQPIERTKLYRTLLLNIFRRTATGCAPLIIRLLGIKILSGLSFRKSNTPILRSKVETNTRKDQGPWVLLIERERKNFRLNPASWLQMRSDLYSKFHRNIPKQCKITDPPD